MAVYEHDGLLTYIDENGNTHILHPVTKLENVEGADKLLSSGTTEDGEEEQHLTGGNSTIIDVATPENPNDAANKEYVDRVVEKVIYVETTSSGEKVEHISGGGTTIINVAAPEQSTDAVNKAYADAIKETAEAAVKRAGDTMQGSLSMGGFQIKNVGTPTEDNDAVTKSYADAGSVGRDVLFTNSDTTSDFGEKEITVPGLSGYDELHVEYSSNTGISEIGVIKSTAVFSSTDTGTYMMYDMIMNGTSLETIVRGCQISGNTIHFSQCGWFANGTMSAANKCLIPTKIIGIKYGGAGTGGSASSAEGVLF